MYLRGKVDGYGENTNNGADGAARGETSG